MLSTHYFVGVSPQNHNIFFPACKQKVLLLAYNHPLEDAKWKVWYVRHTLITVQKDTVTIGCVRTSRLPCKHPPVIDNLNLPPGTYLLDKAIDDFDIASGG